MTVITKKTPLEQFTVLGEAIKRTVDRAVEEAELLIVPGFDDLDSEHLCLISGYVRAIRDTAAKLDRFAQLIVDTRREQTA